LSGLVAARMFRAGRRRRWYLSVPDRG